MVKLKLQSISGENHFHIHVLKIYGNFPNTECSDSNKLSVYRSKKFPYKWQKHIDLFDGKKIADPTIFQDKLNQVWLFVNILNDENNFNSKLNIYKIKNDFSEIIPHKKNPVINSYHNGRGAGNLFYNADGDLIRPSQNNLTKIYGESLNFSKVEELDIENYKEKIFKNIKPNFKFGLKGIHHYSCDKDNFVVDGLSYLKIL